MRWSYGASYGKGRMYWLTHIYESARIRHPRQAEQKRAPIIVQLWPFRAILPDFLTSWAKNLQYFCSARAILSRHHLLNIIICSIWHFEYQMIILAEKLDYFCARISNIRSKTSFWAQNSNPCKRILWFFCKDCCCQSFQNSRSFQNFQTADYLRISKPPLIDIPKAWIFRRLGYPGGLDIQEA